MESAQHCIDQAAECLRLVKLAESKDQAEVLRNLSASWSRLAGQSTDTMRSCVKRVVLPGSKAAPCVRLSPLSCTGRSAPANGRIRRGDWRV